MAAAGIYRSSIEVSKIRKDRFLFLPVDHRYITKVPKSRIGSSKS